MQIKIPKSIFPVTRLIVETPSGVIANMEGDSTFQVANVELPEGVTEDEVSARVEYLDNSRKVITRDVVKEAVVKPVEFRQLRSASEALKPRVAPKMSAPKVEEPKVEEPKVEEPKDIDTE
jgi:hypothetical protein